MLKSLWSKCKEICFSFLFSVLSKCLFLYFWYPLEQTKECRLLCHFQFTRWTDRDIPYPSELVQFYRTVRRAHDAQPKSTLLVHCRSPTFLCTPYFLTVRNLQSVFIIAIANYRSFPAGWENFPNLPERPEKLQLSSLADQKGASRFGPINIRIFENLEPWMAWLGFQRCAYFFLYPITLH